MRVLVCGSRNYTDAAAIDRYLDGLKEVTLVIEGGALGADRLAREWAIRHGVPFLTFEADWQTYGRSAGPIRNTVMLEEGKPDLAGAFPTDGRLAQSRGTRNMVEKLRRAGVPLHIERPL
jgi:YspA, cpYpsA-related SLOG family